MNKKEWSFVKRLCALLVSAFLFLLVSCPGDSTGEANPDDFEMPSTEKLNKNGQRVVMEAWGEPEEDPRCLIGYKLEDGTQFWDRYVILYGGRIAYRNCALDDSEPQCDKTGLHLHYGNNTQKYIYDDYVNKIRPLREAGIKVLMGLVPITDGVAIGSLYRWPNEEYWPWAANNNGEAYPFGEEETERFVREVAAELQKYHLDGVGYDEEYANKAATVGKGIANVYPDRSIYGSTEQQDANAWKIGGENLLKFAYRLQQAMPYKIVQDVYEIRFGTKIPASMTIDGKTVKITDVIDYSFEAYYGNWQANSNNPMPKSKFGPVSVAIADVDTAPLPPATSSGIRQKMKDHLDGNYGMVMYYCFRSRDEIKERWPNKYGTGHPEQEYYFSMISEELFDQRTEYQGSDYPRMWYW